MVKRREHVLTPNKSSHRPSHVVFFDCETKPVPLSDKEDKHVLKLGWACYQRSDEAHVKRQPQWCFFTDISTFWAFVEKHVRPKTKLYLVAHNVSFDFRIVEGFNYTKKAGWKLTFFYNKAKTCILTYRRRKTTLQVLDMTNFFAMSLEAVGKAIGVEKGKVDFDAVSDDALSDYCRQDVEILRRAWSVWLDFLDFHDLGNFKHTLPAQAFNAYRHRFMSFPIHVHNDESVCELEREAYRGGRVEVFWVGKRERGTYYQLDVNSMYAFVMQQGYYPTKLIQSRKHVSVEKLDHLVRVCSVIAQVDLVTDQPVFPVHTGQRNVYPVGSFSSTLTTPELRYALANGMVKKVHRVAWYRCNLIFREYSTYFADLKEQYGAANNKAFRTVAKLFGNSLYGKFGQQGMTTKILPHVPRAQQGSDTVVDVTKIEGPAPDSEEAIRTGQKRRLTTRRAGRTYRLGGDFILESTGGESYNSFPAIAAHVTSYARMYLWRLFLIAGRKNVYYCDTDCLIVNQVGYDHLKHLLDDHKLGRLKVEKQAKSLTIYSAKDYVLGTKVRTKGIRKAAKRLGPNTFEQDQFLGLPGAIRREDPNLVTIKRVVKTLSRDVKTGNVGYDGWITPFRLVP